MCLDRGLLAEPQHAAFQAFCSTYSSLVHHEFHDRLERLKDAYAPFDPDSSGITARPIDGTRLAERQRRLCQGFTDLLEAANYVRVPVEEITAALDAHSLFRVRLDLDLDAFEDLHCYRRDESTRQETIPTWFGLRSRQVTFVNYGRVALYCRESGPEGDGPGRVIMKLFRDVPREDLEMVFPNTQVRMRTIDKLLIGVPALVSGTVVILTKLGGSLALIAAMVAFWLGFREKPVTFDQGALVALALGLGAIGAFLFKQVNGFKNRRIRFMKSLTENLYFKNLDNGSGVFHHLLDAAEEEECKESILAYHELLVADRALTPDEIDGRIEEWLREAHECPVDFEIDDALAKLHRHELVREAEGGLVALDLSAALVRLDRIWDDVFRFQGAAGSGTA